ncbi:ABC transporter ATP-binding protein [Chelativorans sp.]|uniref:ABC transporter ATP-binding protein n=1 Tax=Chelativorans sp. TaxID=2203393 RepID=UPI002812623F|nr:ABC transporter ATP-binding protein [Chelativorans sp.]
MTSTLEVRHLQVEFPLERGIARAVNDVSFTLHPGERLGLVGESGSGKTTTILAMLRLLAKPGRIAGGEVLLDGEDLVAATDETMRRARFSRISLVPQGAMNSLNPVLRIGVQFHDLLKAHGAWKSRGEARAHVARLLEAVELEPGVADLFPHQLSGGMKQRVCIAMAIALKPSVIVADEPTSALDVVVQKQVLRTLVRVQKELSASVILVGHDMALMSQFAHTIGVMYAGRLVEYGPVRQVFGNPRHPYTKMLIASLPSFSHRGRFLGIPGVAPSLLDPPPGCPFHVRCPSAIAGCSRDYPGEWLGEDGHRVSCHLVTEVRDVHPA